jgi:hypothetical protein
MLLHNLVGLIAEQAACSRVPTDDVAVRIDQKDGVLMSGVGQELESLFESPGAKGVLRI